MSQRPKVVTWMSTWDALVAGILFLLVLNSSNGPQLENPLDFVLLALCPFVIELGDSLGPTGALWLGWLGVILFGQMAIALWSQKWRNFLVPSLVLHLVWLLILLVNLADICRLMFGPLFSGNGDIGFVLIYTTVAIVPNSAYVYQAYKLWRAKESEPGY